MPDFDPLRERVLPRLEGVRLSGGQFIARCPAHEDRKASLTVKAGKEHPVALYCHAGCSTEDVLTALSLTWADVSAPRVSPVTTEVWTPAGTATGVYDYRAEDGTLLYQVCRTHDKQFRQRRPDPTAKSGWAWNLEGTRRVLYRLPEIIQAVKDGKEIWVVEGEKDVNNLVALGVEATCNSGGAGKFLTEFAELFRDASVTIVADRDTPGENHARAVRHMLEPVAARVRTVEPAVGKDITNHLEAGKTLAEVEVTYDSQTKHPVSLAPDLWEFIHTADEPYDWVVPGLIERGDRVMLTGHEGLGKSMLIRQMAVCIAAGLHPFTFEETEPKKVLLIDCENSERQSRRKFRPLAERSIMAHRRVPDGGLRLIHRPAGVNLGGEEADWLAERVQAHGPDVLFIGPLYRMHMGNLNEETVARSLTIILDQIRVASQCAMVIETHSGHGKNTSGDRELRPTGSSLLLRWPEFGYGIRTSTQDCYKDMKNVVDFTPWRGARDERDWPAALCWGLADKAWPWQKLD